jgi:hypothetical protein
MYPTAAKVPKSQGLAPRPRAIAAIPETAATKKMISIIMIASSFLLFSVLEGKTALEQHHCGTFLFGLFGLSAIESELCWHDVTSSSHERQSQIL